MTESMTMPTASRVPSKYLKQFRKLSVVCANELFDKPLLNQISQDIASVVVYVNAVN
jgi:hypothetical protein